MATYQSDNIEVNASAEQVYSRLSNLEGLGDLLKKAPADQIPDDQRQMLENIKITADSITFPAGGVGEIKLSIKEKIEPSRIVLVGVDTPVPMTLTFDITPLTSETCHVKAAFDLQIPAMLKMMFNGPMQKMVNQFAQMAKQLPFT